MNLRLHRQLGRLAAAMAVCVGVIAALGPHAHAGHESERLAKPCAVCQVYQNLSAIDADHQEVSDPFEAVSASAHLAEDSLRTCDAVTPSFPRAPPAA